MPSPPARPYSTPSADVANPTPSSPFRCQPIRTPGSTICISPTPPSKTCSQSSILVFTTSTTSPELDRPLRGCVTVPRPTPFSIPAFLQFYIEAFIATATSKGSSNKLCWLEEARILFESMKTGTDAAAPNATTYTLVLVAWFR